MFKKLAKHGVLVAVIIIALLALLANGFTRVPVGSTGIMVTLGRVQDGSTLSEGLHFHLPFLQEILRVGFQDVLRSLRDLKRRRAVMFRQETFPVRRRSEPVREIERRFDPFLGTAPVECETAVRPCDEPVIRFV